MEAAATLTDSIVTVTLADGTTLTSTKGKRAENATHVVVTRWAGKAYGLYSLRSDKAAAEREALSLVTLSKRVTNPAAEAFVVAVAK